MIYPGPQFTPTGNPTPTTMGCIVVQASSVTFGRQFLGSFNFISGTDNGTSGADHVALYTGMEAVAGSSNVWSMNPLLALDSGAPTTINGQNMEVDTNNNNANRGATGGPTGTNTPVCYGIAVSGASSFSSTSGICVSGVTTTQWYRGVTVTGSSVYSALSDYSAATTGIEMIATHSVGIDMNGSNLTTAMRVPNNSPISAENAAGTGVVQICNVDGSNNLSFGSGSAGIFLDNTVEPGTNNAYSLGSGSSHQWSNIYSQNDVTVNSDPSLKNSISALPESLPLIKAINPVTFKFNMGGMQAVQVTQEETVHDEEVQEYSVEHVEVVNGKAVLTERAVRNRMPAFDEVPVFDASGNPVMHDLPDLAEIKDESGKIIRQAQKGRSVQRTHRAPRMVTKQVTKTVLQPRAGNRTHWGFLASDVKAAFDKTGVDFGGYVKGEDGIEGLRHGQMVSVLWKGLQEAVARIEALETKLQTQGKS